MNPTTDEIAALAAQPATPAICNDWVVWRRARLLDLATVLDEYGNETKQSRAYANELAFPAWLYNPPEHVAEQALADIITAVPGGILSLRQTQFILRMRCHHLVECRVDLPALSMTLQIALRAAIAKAKAAGLPAQTPPDK